MTMTTLLDVTTAEALLEIVLHAYKTVSDFFMSDHSSCSIEVSGILYILPFIAASLVVIVRENFVDNWLFLYVYAYPVICILCSIVFPLHTFKLSSSFGKIWIPLNLILACVYSMITLEYWNHLSIQEANGIDKCSQWIADMMEILNRTDVKAHVAEAFIYVQLFYLIIAFHTAPSVIKISYNLFKRLRAKWASRKSEKVSL